MKRIAAKKIPIAIALALVASLGGFAYVHFSGNTRSTENAYISADVVSVASLVAGRVTAVRVKDNQHVRKGDVLFDIDPEPFAIALPRAQADLARAQVAQIGSDLANARAAPPNPSVQTHVSPE